MRRKTIKNSVRFSVFERDGFMCRYCGAKPESCGVVLVVDHVFPVAHGGGNEVENLATACVACNSGKGARVLRAAPSTDEVCYRQMEMRSKMVALADVMRRSLQAEEQIDQMVRDMKAHAYRTDGVVFVNGEVERARRLVSQYGLDAVRSWYRTAARKVDAAAAIRYVCGCARNHKSQMGRDAAPRSPSREQAKVSYSNDQWNPGAILRDVLAG